VTTALERRLAEVEAMLDAITPKPTALDRFKAKCPAIDWLTTDELMALDEMMRAADVETVGDLGEADQARASAIYFAAEARRLSGAPKDIDLPQEPYDIRASYERSKRALELKGR
jgi:hypothetical protein